MAEVLDWRLQFDLVGQGLTQAKEQMATLQGQLEKGQKALFEFEAGGKRVQVELEGMGRAAQKAGGLFGEAIGALGGVAAAAGTVAAAIGVAFHKLDEFGTRAVEAAGERSGVLRTWAALYEDAGKAAEDFSRTQQHALQTPFLSSTLEQTRTQLLGQDLRGGDLDRTQLALEDLATRHHDRNFALQRGTYAIDEILSEGHLSQKRLRQLSIDLMLPTRRLQEASGMSPEQFHAAVKGGTIDNAQFLWIFQEAARLHTKESRLGETATAGGGSLSTLLINQGEQVKNLLKTVDLEQVLPGMQRYKEALKDQAELFNAASERSRNVSLTLQDFANTSTSLKATWEDFVTGFVESFSTAYAEMMKELGIDQAKLNSFGDSAKSLGHTLGQIGAPIALVMRGFEELAPLASGAAYWLEYFGGIIKATGEVIGSTLGFLFETITHPTKIKENAKLLGESYANLAGAAFKPTKDVAGILYDAYSPTHAAVLAGRQRDQGLPPLLARDDEGPAVGVPPLLDRNAFKGGHGGSKGGGAGHGGGGGTLGTFRPDYSGLSGGLVLPHLTLPGASSALTLSTQNYVADQQRKIAAGLAKPPPAVVKVEGVTIEVTGDMDAQEVAQRVHDVLRGLGRFARTPAPDVT